MLSTAPPDSESFFHTEPKPKVAVIGAGASGLAAIKECLAVGLTVTCFEQSNDIGGLWRYEEPKAGKEVHSSVYRNTIINTSKPMMAFSDYPIPHSWPTFLHNKAILKYFEDYTSHFDLKKFIRFGTKVVSVAPIRKFIGNEKEKWEIILEEEGGSPKIETFEFVFIATGHHWKPLRPDFQGLENFQGEVMHSHNYRDASQFKDKRCLVVGIGNSGVDMAVELSYHAKQVFLSSRKSAWVAPRYTITGAPADQVLSRFFYWLPMFIRNIIFAFSVWLTFGNIARFGLLPKHAPFSAHATVSGELCPRIGTGTIKLAKNIKRFLSGETDSGAKGRVEFEDGSIMDVDIVFLATGYEIGYPFLDAKTICGLNQNQVSMYKFMWPLKHKNIVFIGLVQPYGSIMPISEIQCRWAARVFAKKAKKLVSENDMHSDILKVQREMSERYISSQRHTIQVDAGPYMDEIAKFIDAAPCLLYTFITDPILWFKLVFGCWTPHQYRLVGPDAWNKARSQIMLPEYHTDSDQESPAYWVDWFLSLKGHEFFCQVDEDFIIDRFNLAGLYVEVPHFQQAFELITDSLNPEDFEQDFEPSLWDEIEASARHLYGLIHSRFIITARGLSKMNEKFKLAEFGRCPRVLCHNQPVLPIGLLDSPGLKGLKLYCPHCEDVYTPPSRRHSSIDGSYFGTSFPHLIFQAYPELMPSKSLERYIPKIFGFKLHSTMTEIKEQEEIRQKTPIEKPLA